MLSILNFLFRSHVKTPASCFIKDSKHLETIKSLGWWSTRRRFDMLREIKARYIQQWNGKSSKY